MKTPRGLKALLALLREHGVTEYSAGGVTIRLGAPGQHAWRQGDVDASAFPVEPGGYLATDRSTKPPPVSAEPQDPRWAAVNELKRQWKASHDG